MIGRVVICCLLACVLLAPMDADAAKKRKRSKARTTATTSKKRTTARKHTTAKTATTKPAGSKSVTEATQEVAINASKKKTVGNSALMKITVDKPDLEEIRISTLDPKNNYYFPKLMAKFERNDTTMKPDEYRYLYLGYMFQEDYDPYRLSPYSEVTDSLRRKGELDKNERAMLREYAEKALKDNPFDLRQMSLLVHALKESKKFMSAKIWEYRLEHLLAAIKSTGTGEDEENAWYVIYPMHEYDMVQLLGYEAVDVEYIEPGYDHLLVEPDGSVNHRKPASGFYFNVQVPQQQYMLKYDEEEATEVEEVEVVDQVVIN